MIVVSVFVVVFGRVDVSVAVVRKDTGGGGDGRKVGGM